VDNTGIVARGLSTSAYFHTGFSLPKLFRKMDRDRDGGRGFDLVFIDRRYTLIEEDTVQSRRFGQLLRSLKPAAQQGNALKDSSGAKLLVMEVRFLLRESGCF